MTRRMLMLSLLACCLLAGGCDDGESPHESADAETRAAAQSAQPPAAPTLDPAPLTVDLSGLSMTFSARVAEQRQYAEHLHGAIEYAIVDKTGKTYETILVSDPSAGELADAMKALGLPPGVPGNGETPPQGPRVRIEVTLVRGPKMITSPISELMRYRETSEQPPVPPGQWVYTGSTRTTDPATGNTTTAASATGAVAGLHWADASPLIQNPRPEAGKENIYAVNADALPSPGSVVHVTITRVLPDLPAGTRRVRITVSGRVRGVGYRTFVQNRASALGLTGWTANSGDAIEVDVEGPAGAIDKLLEQMRTGPRAARVEAMAIREARPTGDYDSFRVRHEDAEE